MKRKSIVVLLVLLLVGILAFSAFACNGGGGKDPDKNGGGSQDDDDDDKNNNQTTPNDLDKALNALINGADGVIKEVAAIEDEAYVGTDVKLAVNVGEGAEAVTVGLTLSLKASLSENDAEKNWAFVSVDVEADGENNSVALYAQAESKNKELVYVGQSLTDSEYTWTKLSQLDVSKAVSADSRIQGGLFTGDKNLVTKVFDAIQKLQDSEITLNKKTKTFKEFANSGLLGSGLGLSGMIILAAPIAGPLLPTTTTDYGYSAKFDLLQVGKILPQLLGVLGGSDEETGGDEADTGDDMLTTILNGIGPIVLGMTYEQLMGEAPISDDPDDFPNITLDVLTEGSALTGLRLHYDYDVSLTGNDADSKYISLDLAIENLEISSEAKAAEVPDGIDKAEEFAAQIALNAAVPALNGAAAEATVNVFVKPDVKVGLDKDGYVAIDFSGLEGYATLSYKRGTDAATDAVMVAQYKEELGGFVIDLEPVFGLAGANSVNGQYDFFIPLDAQGMFDKWIDGKKPAASTSAAAPLNSAASIDKIIGGIAGMFDQNGKFTFNFGSIMNLISPVIDVFQSLGAIADDADFIEIDEITDGSSVVVHLAALMENLISDNGLIGGLTSGLVEFKLYNGTDSDKDTYTLAEILDGDDVLGHIVTLVNSLIYESKLDAWIASDANTITIEKSATWIASWKEANAKEEDEEDADYDARATKAYEEYVAGCEKAMFDAAVAAVGTYEACVTANPGSFIEIDNVYAWAAKLGISLSADQSNLYEAIGDIEATVSYRDGISAELSLAGITIGISANIEEYVAPETDMVKPDEKKSSTTVTVKKDTNGDGIEEDVTETEFSNYTATDSGRLLYNTLKELANAALLDVTDGTDKFEQNIATVQWADASAA